MVELSGRETVRPACGPFFSGSFPTRVCEARAWTETPPPRPEQPKGRTQLRSGLLDIGLARSLGGCLPPPPPELRPKAAGDLLSASEQQSRCVNRRGPPSSQCRGGGGGTREGVVLCLPQGSRTSFPTVVRKPTLAVGTVFTLGR